MNVYLYYNFLSGRTSSQQRNQCHEENDDGCVDEVNVEQSCSKLIRRESDSLIRQSNNFTKRYYKIILPLFYS